MKELFPGLEIGRPTRDACGDALVELGREHDDVFVLSADRAGNDPGHAFGAAFPDRYRTAEDAGEDLLQQARELAGSGGVAFVTSTRWPTVRSVLDALEQGGEPAPSVKIVAAYPELGADTGDEGRPVTDDRALASRVPDLCVAVPADEHETEAVVRAAGGHGGPVLIRAGTLNAPRIHEASPAFAFGRGDRVRPGRDVTIIATGVMAAAAVVAHHRLAEMGVSARVVNMASLRPLDVDLIEAAARETGAIVTADACRGDGGLGSAVAAALEGRHPVPMEHVGLRGHPVEGDSPAERLIRNGLTAAHVMGAVHDVMERKASPVGGAPR